MKLVWKPHFHAIGFIGGGYDVCRNCAFLKVSKNRVWCSSSDECKGFEQRTRRAYDVDKVVVKVHDKRKTLEGTTKYLLSHTTKKVGIKCEHIVTYFGVLANKKLKSVKVAAVHACPVCASVGVHNVAVKSYYFGEEHIATNVGDPLYVSTFASEEFDREGRPLFVDCGGGGSSV
jgi:hypothetical protein